MGPVALGLGSNSGDRLAHLRFAVSRLERDALRNLKISPVVETAAWLKPGAPSAWDQPFLNMVIEGDPKLSAQAMLETCQAIERGERPSSCS